MEREAYAEGGARLEARRGAALTEPKSAPGSSASETSSGAAGTAAGNVVAAAVALTRHTAHVASPPIAAW